MIEVEKAKIIRGEVMVPGDKSISHRAVILAGIAQGTSRIKNICPGKDVKSTVSCMKLLGTPIEKEAGELVVYGNGRSGLTEAGNVLDCGNSGTTARLLLGLLSGYPFWTVFTGDSSLRQRPMGRVKSPLEEMGARFVGRKDGERLPIGLRGGGLRGIRFTLPVASAQVKSAVLLAGLSAQGVTSVIEEHVTRNHTERFLKTMGASISSENGTVSLDGGPELLPIDIDIPGDLSSAAYLIALAVIVKGSSLLIKKVGVNSTRTGFLSLLERMGAKITVMEHGTSGPEPVGDILIEHSPLKGISLSRGEVVASIDELPLLSVLATQADGQTSIRHAGELRVKETDRITAIAEGLRNMGAQLEEEEDGLTLTGPVRLKGAACRSFGDHRIAMSMTVAGLVAEGRTTVTGSECVDISFPGFMTRVKEVISS